MMTQIRGMSNAKAKRELGWSPRYRSYREGFLAGLADPASPARPAQNRPAQNRPAQNRPAQNRPAQK